MKAWIFNSRILIEKYRVCNLPVIYNNYYNSKDIMFNTLTAKIADFKILSVYLAFLLVFATTINLNSQNAKNQNNDFAGVKIQFGSKDFKERRLAIKKLSEIKDFRKIDLLKKAMKDSDPIVRGKAAVMMGGETGKSSFLILSDGVKSKDQSLRLGSIEGLSKVKTKSAVFVIVNLLGHKDRNTRWKAVEVLGKIKNDIAVKPLLKLSRSEKEEHIKKAVIVSLYKIGSKKAVSALNEIKNGEDKKSSKRAENALKVLGK